MYHNLIMFVTCIYCGGLGNQLFQVATTISTAIDQEKKYKFVVCAV